MFIIHLYNTHTTTHTTQNNGIEETGLDSSNSKHFFSTLDSALETNSTLKACDVNDNLIGNVGGQGVIDLYTSREGKGLYLSGVGGVWCCSVE